MGGYNPLGRFYMTRHKLRFALIQCNPIVGDLEGNVGAILSSYEAVHRKADIVIFPELCLTGYPPKDLLLVLSFMEKVESSLKKIQESVGDAYLFMGAPSKVLNKSRLYNSLYVFHKKALLKVVHKTLLPFYDVFDEPRYFLPGGGSDEDVSITISGIKIGCTICEDIWTIDPKIADLYLPPFPLDEMRDIDCIVNISASPWFQGKSEQRQHMVSSVAKKMKAPVIYVNQVGANDGILFDGRSMIVMPEEGVVSSLLPFQEDVHIYHLDFEETEKKQKIVHQTLDPMEELFCALKMGIQDYFRKSKIVQAVIGISGGIDSMLTAALVCEALGKENLLCVMMPSRYTTKESLEDAKSIVSSIGAGYLEINIDSIAASCKEAIGLVENNEGVVWQNIQARIRAVILMGIANRDNRVVVCTSNKSELSQGYTTIYGDAIGAFSPIGDLVKEEIYLLSRWIDRNLYPIPNRFFTKEPSAELSYNQKDSDTLFPYPVLDLLVQSIVEETQVPQKPIDLHTCTDKNREVFRKKLDLSEYKRAQAPFALKVSPVTFGTGRRFPIVQQNSLL